MAEDPTAPALNLSPEEKRVFGQLFRQADTENIGVVTGEVAVKFFEKTRLEPRILGEIWQIADKENRGLLTPAGFGIVLRLIGHYQAGRDPTPELALRPGPLPKFDGGLVTPTPTFQPPAGPPPAALQPQPSGSGPIRVPPLSAEKSTQYAQLFEKSGAQGGILPGEQAKQIFERAGLPNEILGRIWNLADTEQRGALTSTEFVIAMHLLASFKSGQLRALPNILPAGLYEAAARRGAPNRQSTGNNISAMPRQFSGQHGRANSPLSRPAYASPQQMPQQIPQPTGGEWAISPVDKQRFDGIYHTLDRTGKGYITGDEAVPFFSDSKLPEEVLAQIWDLADINSAGHLTTDEFAVAMYLIRQQRGKKDGRDSLPATLPPNLIPPSMRNQVRPAPMPTAPAFESHPPTMPKSAADDLFGLDALSSPPAPVQAPQSTGGSASFGPNRQLHADPFGVSAQPLAPSSPVQQSPQHTGSVFKPFVPSSSFGHTLTAHLTGGSNNSAPNRAFSQQPSVSEDLLGDNDPEISSKLTSETTELANLSNQVGTLSTQMQQVQSQRSATQNELTQADSQKQQFEARLGQLRALYEQEVKDVRSLEERLNASRNETKKLQTEMAMLEATYTDVQTQHRQIVTALQADQQENASLKERMRVVNAEITQLKPALEKLRSDARQQKGLVAINKKQLATNESERDKLKGEASDLTKSIEEDTAALAAAARARSQSPVQARAQSPASVASPAPSTMSANNPFFKRQATGGSNTDMGSAFAASPVQQTDRSFENVFGPAFGSALPHQETAAPPTSFKQDLPTRPQTSGGFSTPSITGEAAPPMPASRQISSSFLPFPTHDDSVSSSRQVSAPNSRFGDNSTGGETPTNYMGTTPTGSSITNQTEPVITARAVSPDIDRRSTASPAVTESKDSIPGAFPGDDNSNIVATPTGGTTLSEQVAADPFATTKEPVRSGTAKDDFDAAFAGFGNSSKAPERSNTGSSTEPSVATAASPGFGQEFPPISELDNDDESDSASEGGFGGGGFDDDFNPASPAQVRKAAEGTTGGAKELSNTPAPAATVGGDPPTPNAQASPPAYDKAVSPADQAHSEVQQYSGLLPSREVPPSEHSSATAAPQTSSQPAPPVKVPFDDDFGDEFDDLEDAKEGEADDEFANAASSIHESRNGLDDFNPMFDSPPTSKHQDHSGNSFGGDASGFGDFTSPPKPTATGATAVNDNHDWDAIFAGLDAPGGDASASAAQGNGNGAGAASNDNSIAGGAPSGSERPLVGRALTEAGEHDDPILKNLTGMGYKRNDALAALEKYDYNLERAANFLASQS
ncbi:fecf3476-7cb4-41c4-a840-cb1daf72ee50 [Sclerotinia trifoliorum]|uniref:Fecf3476-7cb4-41c4-a840-cb1daf72ee50 n=1 Tax=Sclerotinia trifoliorum TaxID=28548 RepID=A0A8H2VRF6_9HELO|nr:fecf3476-7cb4-41c4-a840-cb1daf72ee50 [Sclerotinia trifoliorum]